MKDTLVYEDWMDSELLPSGWKYKVFKSKSHGRHVKFLTSNCVFLNSSTHSHELMESDSQYDNEDINKLVMFTNIESRLKTNEANKKRIAGYTWNNNDDTIPKGWKSRTDGKSKYLLSPDGIECGNRREAIRHMVSSQFDEGQIEEMRSFLVLDGWQDNENLPSGWKMKIKHHNNLVISKEGDLFISYIQEADTHLFSFKFGP